MKSIIVCNTGADSLSRVILNNLTLEKITFNLGEKPVGPHGITTYEEGFITTNSYSDSISFFDKNTFKEKKNAKIGPSPNDLIVYKNKVYIICSESNSSAINLTLILITQRLFPQLLQQRMVAYVLCEL